MSEARFARFTDDPEGDIGRGWCYQPADLAMAWLPSRPLDADEIAGAIERIREDDPTAARALAEQAEELEWTGANWSVRMPGIPGLELDDDESVEDVLDALRGVTTVSGTARYLVVYEGEWAGDEYEGSVTTGRACRFLPQRIVRLVEVLP